MPVKKQCRIIPLLSLFLLATSCVQDFNSPLIVVSSFAAREVDPSSTVAKSATVEIAFNDVPIVEPKPDWDWSGTISSQLSSVRHLGGRINRFAAYHNHSSPDSYEVRGQQYKVLASANGYVNQGRASWYGEDFHGKPTANGDIYNMYGFSAAHRELPLGTCLLVTNKKNQHKIAVEVNDRGPFSQFSLDLSYAAAKQLDMIEQGSAPVEMRAVNSYVCQLFASLYY